MPRPAWLLAAVALAGPGCASFSAYRAQAARERAGLERFRYAQPLDVVWPQLQRLLADRGLALAGLDAAAVGQKSGVMAQFASAAKETRSTPTGGLVLETGWNQDGVRWRAEAEPAEGGLRVVLTRIARNLDEFGRDGVTLRDWELELDLRPDHLQRLAVVEAPQLGALVCGPVPVPGEGGTARTSDGDGGEEPGGESGHGEVPFRLVAAQVTEAPKSRPTP